MQTHIIQVWEYNHSVLTLKTQKHFAVFLKLFFNFTERINTLTPWIRVLPEELLVAQLVKKLPAFYWNQKFITVFPTDLPPLDSILSQMYPVQPPTILFLQLPF
jgi:hypothetical protein